MKIKLSIAFFLMLSVLFGQHSVLSEDILITSDSIKLPGTLTYLNHKSPLIIWISGSGNIDRNGNQASYNVKADYIKQFRDSINKKGISFFSYDKRTANPENIKYKNDIVFEDFIDDAKTVIDHFRDDRRFSGIILIGHSQGSLVAMLASKNIDKYISLEGASDAIDKVLVQQIIRQSPIAGDTLRSELNELRETGTIKYINPYLRTLLPKQNLLFLKSWMEYDPAKEIKKISIPILIINGIKDTQVLVDDAQALYYSNPNSKLVLIENMNHVLKDVQTDEDNLKSYYLSDYPLSKKLINEVADFILKL